MKPIPFQYTLKVPASAIDQLNHVNNVIYLQWVQDVAEKHWIAKTPVSIREKFGWVVLDHYIEYMHPSFLGEKLLLKTWIESYGNIKSERRTEIFRASDQKIIAKARTTWCYVDLKNNKPTRITPEVTVPYFK